VQNRGLNYFGVTPIKKLIFFKEQITSLRFCFLNRMTVKISHTK